MKRILAASDLSGRSRRALRRAIALAAQHKAELNVLYVADDDAPEDIIADEQRHARRALRALTAELGADKLSAPPSILTVAGDPFRAIADEADILDADLVVMGAHRKRLLGDIFTGTTIERVIRTGGRPVLMVNTDSDRPYASLLAAVDAEPASIHALRAARDLGFFDGREPALVHGCAPVEETLMSYANVDRKRIEEEVTEAIGRARTGILSLLEAQGLANLSGRLLLEKAAPFDAIEKAAGAANADLVIIGTRGHGGVRRLLLGSVTDEVLRKLDIDILAVPPPA